MQGNWEDTEQENEMLPIVTITHKIISHYYENYYYIIYNYS